MYVHRLHWQKYIYDCQSQPIGYGQNNCRTARTVSFVYDAKKNFIRPAVVFSKSEWLVLAVTEIVFCLCRHVECTTQRYMDISVCSSMRLYTPLYFHRNYWLEPYATFIWTVFRINNCQTTSFDFAGICVWALPLGIDLSTADGKQCIFHLNVRVRWMNRPIAVKRNQNDEKIIKYSYIFACNPIFHTTLTCNLRHASFKWSLLKPYRASEYCSIHRETSTLCRFHACSNANSYTT